MKGLISEVILKCLSKTLVSCNPRTQFLGTFKRWGLVKWVRTRFPETQGLSSNSVPWGRENS